MEVSEAIEKRFSVRSYKGEVSNEQLQHLLNAARLAPSGRNRQAWKLVVVRDAAIKTELAKACEQPFVGTAPVVLAIVSLDPNDKMYCGVESAPVDCAIVLDHISLAAVAEGLGTCWIGHFNQSAARRVLGIPDNYKIVEIMPVGEPASRVAKKQRKPLEEVICYDKFSAGNP